eukprot:TRINITY_DN4259_c0_g1_i1.p1 TRINITY_DN4259_c0_g1~~TRINITY_DN4259_c0_g1_i1.p1  ORF type:complete len:703 (-),score=275.79 TRINITY_DN4259_c0_g1_i1:242-2350(-)
MGLFLSVAYFSAQAPLLVWHILKSFIGIPPKETQYSFEFGGHHEGEGRPHRSNDGIPALISSTSTKSATCYEVLQDAVKKYGGDQCLGSRPLLQTVSKDRTYTEGGRQVTKKWTFFEMGKYRWLSYRDVLERVDNLGRGLVSLGLEPGNSRIAIHLETCPEWVLTAHACFSQSLTASTIYATLGEAGLVHIINEGQIPLLVTDADYLPVMARLVPKCPTLKFVVYVSTASQENIAALNNQGVSTYAFTELEQRGAGVRESVKPYPAKNGDVALVMYTSGTTGAPKGVMLTHANMVAMLGATESIVKPMGIGRTDAYVAYLPLAHVLEFILEHLMMFNGVPVGFGNPRTLTKESMHNCLGDLEELRPTLMAGVPRVWDKVRKEVLDQISKRPAWQQKLAAFFFAAKRLCLEAGVNTDLLDRVFFNNIRKAVGGRTRIILSGAAPLSSEAHWFLRAALSPIVLQGYGLTETTGFSTVMRHDQLTTGTVGAPAGTVEIKLVDAPELGYTSEDQPLPRGEVWIRGSTVTLGYFRNEEKTREAYHDGWFATGDIGQWNRDGTLSLIDRLKNLIKLSNGEYIAPERLESLFALSPYVDTIMVHADPTRDYAVALIVPARKQLLDWARKEGIEKSYEELCLTKEAEKEVHASLEVVARRENLAHADRPKRVLLLSDPWTSDNDMLTVTSKLKRASVAKRFAKEITKLYD